MNAQRGGILVLDDDTRVCRSLARLLGGAGYRVETFSTPRALLAAKVVSEPACLILDLRLGTTHGMDLLQSLKDGERELAVIILTAYGDVPTAVEAMRRGADDFIQKPYDPEELLEAVSRALARAGARFGEKGELSKLRARAARLTSRERQVIHLVLSGMLNKEIADHLGLAEVTIKIHRSHAMRKLGAHNAAQLARLAGFLEPGFHSAAE